jgi:ribose/xylose/arabinose/galactoside ABC-type transport system permease subunit
MNTSSHSTDAHDVRTTPKSVVGDIWAGTRTFRPVLLLLIVVSAVLSITQEGFMTTVNLQNIATSVSVLWIVALGATFVQLSGGIDLSSGAIAGIAGICLTKLLGTTVPEPMVILLVVLFGAALGAVINGVLVGIFNLNVFVVTLASMTAITGAISLWSGTQSTYVFSDTVTFLAIDKFLGLPMPMWIMAVTFLAFLFLQTRTYFGRDIYAIGGSMTAARLSGIRTARTLIVVWGVAGGMAALAGIIAVGRIGASAPQPDNTLPLSAIAAILLGGTALSGGMGGVGGTILGVLFIGVLQNGLSLSGAPTYWQQIVTGFILVAAVMGDRIQSHSAWIKLRDRRKRGSTDGGATGGTPSAGDTGAPATVAHVSERQQDTLPAVNGRVRA